MPATSVSPPANAPGSSTTRAQGTLVVGGGPAGLTAAYELLKHDPEAAPLVLEATDKVGGIARTEEYKGYRFDIGGHRFFTKVKEVEALWHEVMGEDFIDVPRQSRIYYQGKFYDYPLSMGNTLKNLGPYESARILLSYLKWKVKPSQEEENFEQWVSNRFGGRLFWHFFRTYTEKVWGIPCTEIRADWAAQRIKDLSLKKAVFDAITGKSDTTSLIKTFKYPPLGPGQMWERFAERIEERGGEVRMRTRVHRFRREGNRVVAAELRSHTDHADHPRDRDAASDREEGTTYWLDVEDVISTMPLTALVRAFDPPAPDKVLAAADGLNYRDFLIVTLILDQKDPFPDNWIYIHSPEVKVGRIQNFRSWSEAMVPHPDHASVGMEYFCHRGDGLWTSTDEELIALATRELGELNLSQADRVIDGTVIRQPKAYPVYDADYKKHVDTIEAWVRTLENLHTVGRNGMHRYNNQDHSMLSAMHAARNVLGGNYDPWNINVERSYHEEFVVKDKASARKSATSGLEDAATAAERMQPAGVAPAATTQA